MSIAPIQHEMSFGKEPVREKPVEVAAEIATEFDVYHYKVPENLAERLVLGMRVLVPLRNRRVTGYFLGYSKGPEGVSLKEIIDLLDEEPLFDEKMLSLFRFVAGYLFHPIGEVIKSALPAGINVESRQRVRLTEIGELACSGKMLHGPKREIAEALQAGEVPTLTLLRSVVSAKNHHLQRLIKDGYVEVRDTLTKPRNRLKLVRFYKVLDGVSVARVSQQLRRSAVQKKIYYTIENAGEISITHLRKQLGSVHAPLRSLLKKGLIDVEEREEIQDRFFQHPIEKIKPPKPTEDQQRAIEQAMPGIKNRTFQPFLLHGVTGSGKTEVYIRLIEETMNRGRQALVLVPEISLTPQFVSYFRSRVGDDLAVLHSGLNERERLEQWWRIRRGEVNFAIGARSAIFAPFEDLGLVIVDEEQEGSYKQEGRVPYHARNIALVRGKYANATVILGSATPSMETFHNAQIGKLGLLSLPERVHGRPLPDIQVIDLRQVERRSGGILSPQLETAIQETLAIGGQTILFLNRRGYHTTILCSQCGYRFRCIDCSVGLTYHYKQNMILCHYCGYGEQLPKNCPRCGMPDVEHFGLGTQKVQEIIANCFPDARVERMDRDTTSGKGTLESLLKRFEQREIDILIGTQMITKGHDFPGVLLVGVLLADMGMNLPDFRSAERTFQMLVQASGRAGRGETPGRVLIQTFNPEHLSIRFGQHHDYHGFYEPESRARKELGYPPYGWLVLIRIDGEDMEKTRAAAEQIGRGASELLHSGHFPNVVFLGPSPSPLERIKRRFRWQILFKSVERTPLHHMVYELNNHVIPGCKRKGVKISIDTDPIQML